MVLDQQFLRATADLAWLPPECLRVTRARPLGRDGQCILYWMSASCRAEHNYALEAARLTAAALGLPLLVFFCLDPSFPSATERSFRFLLEGLREAARAIHRRGIGFELRLAPNGVPDAVVGLCDSKRCEVLFTDVQYPRTARRWRDDIAARAACAVVEVEDNVLVPTRLIGGLVRGDHPAVQMRRRQAAHFDRFARVNPPVCAAGGPTHSHDAPSTDCDTQTTPAQGSTSTPAQDSTSTSAQDSTSTSAQDSTSTPAQDSQSTSAHESIQDTHSTSTKDPQSTSTEDPQSASTEDPQPTSTEDLQSTTLDAEDLDGVLDTLWVAAAARGTVRVQRLGAARAQRRGAPSTYAVTMRP